MKDYTHICIVLDASGSMSSIEDDTKGSFNAFLKTQKEAAGKTVFDLYQFSDVGRQPDLGQRPEPPENALFLKCIQGRARPLESQDTVPSHTRVDPLQ